MDRAASPPPSADSETTQAPSPTSSTPAASSVRVNEPQDVEKGNSGDGDGSGESADEADQDGVRMVDGTPIVGLTGPDDPFSPLHFPKAKKWLIICVISSASFCVTCCSSLIPSSYAAVEQEFGVSAEVVTLGLSLFVLGLGFAPLLLGPLSEFVGRSPVYLVSYFFFIAFNFQVAFSNNITCFLIGRFLAGAAGSAFLSVAGGSVSDIFAPHAVAGPMGFYTASPFLGPVFGPVISGFINQHLNWRWTWYILIIWAFAEWIALLLFVPETFEPKLLVKKAKMLRKQGRTDVRAPLEMDTRSVSRVIITSCARPFELLATEPMALLLCTWTAILLGILYMFFSAFSIVYTPYGFNQEDVGLSFLGIGIGIFLGVVAHPIWAGYYRRATEKTGKRPPPEEHLRKGMWGAVLVPISLFWFAFTTYPSVPWPVSIVATIPFGIGVIWSFQSVFVYLIDCWRPIAASAMAANSCMRSSFAAGFPLFTEQMFKKLGTQWALGLCAFLTLAMAPFPFLFFKYGPHLRRNSKFAQAP